MRVSLGFQQVRQFHPVMDSICRQVSAFEDAVAKTFDKVGRVFLPVMGRRDTEITANYDASIGEIVITNSSLSDIKVTFPVPTKENLGRWIHIVRRSASNAVTVLPTFGKVDNATSATVPAAVGMFMFQSDGTGWWRVHA